MKNLIRDFSWFSFWAASKERRVFQRLTSWTGPVLDEEIGEGGAENQTPLARVQTCFPGGGWWINLESAHTPLPLQSTLIRSGKSLRGDTWNVFLAVSTRVQFP